MLSKGRVVAGVALALVMALGAAGCGMNTKAQAAKDIARFLGAVMRHDQAGFEAGLDRPEVESDLREQLTELGRAKGVDVGEPSEFAIGRMITPDAFHLLDARTGQPLAGPPSEAQVAAMLKVRNGTHVCLDEAATHRCRIGFAKRGDAWRLTAVPLGDLRIEVPPVAKP